jgi:hypothetical protein
VLYRTNSQSRLVEEALRRYNIRYTMVGGFSFYERAEIKDLLGYLRLVRNPHDSMALQRVINTPARGIGKTTLETLERLALETGKSTWDALAPRSRTASSPRAQMALDSFRQLILDAQAMMDPDFAGKLSPMCLNLGSDFSRAKAKRKRTGALAPGAETLRIQLRRQRKPDEPAQPRQLLALRRRLQAPFLKMPKAYPTRTSGAPGPWHLGTGERRAKETWETNPARAGFRIGCRGSRRGRKGRKARLPRPRRRRHAPRADPLPH